MSLAKAQTIIASNTRAEEINLEGLGLDTIAPLLPSLAALTRLRRLRLGGNRLVGLPTDLSALKSLTFLDLSSNPIAGLGSIVQGLQMLTNLKHLYVDLVVEEEEDEIIVMMASLESFNGTPLTDTADPPPPRAAVRVTPEGRAVTPTSQIPGGNASGGAGVERSVGASTGASHTPPIRPPAMVGSSPTARARWSDADSQDVQRLHRATSAIVGGGSAEFDEYMRNVLGHLQNVLHTEEDASRRELEILKAKKVLVESCVEDVSRAAGRYDTSLAQALAIAQETYSSMLDQHERLLVSAMESKERRLEVMKGDMQGALQEIEELVGRAERGDADAAQQRELQAARTDRESLVEECGWLRTENEKLKTRVRQLELARGNSGGASARATTPMASTIAPSPLQTAVAPPSASSPRVGGSAGKNLTLRQLRDVIEEIYASKSKYDLKCAESHLPRETMEQHMYTHLNQKYGLRHIILDWAAGIIQGVKRFAIDDHDVAVFGKILRNEIDEEFRFVLRQLRETVRELLRVYVRGKYPMKTDEDVQAIVKRKVEGTLVEEEWIDIVKYMYNSDDAVSIIMRLRDLLRRKERPARQSRARSSLRAKSTDESQTPKILYVELVHTLVEFQLEGHERFLAPFLRVFRQSDSDRNGIVNEHEFCGIVRAIDGTKSDDDVAALLDLVDPHNHQLITFSECVTYLSSELIRLAQEERTARPAE